MSCRFAFMLFAVIAGLNSTIAAPSPAEYARVNVDGGGKIAIVPLTVSPQGRAANVTWGDQGKRRYSAVFEIPASGTQWTEFSFSFKPESDGQVAINLVGPYVAAGTGKKRIDILWDDLSAQGSSIRNGDFETSRGGNPSDWYRYSPKQASELMARYFPASERRGRNDSAVLMTWHDGGAVQYIPVKKDVPVVIRGFCRLAEAGLTPVSVPVAKPVTKVVLTADAEWRAADMNDLVIKPGSALDMEARLPSETAGKYGRVIINRNGNFAFADQPDKEVVFFGCSFGDVELSKLKTKEDVRKFAALLRRQGYNLARLHFLDHYLMADSKADFDFNLERLDLMDYLIFCFKEHGVYLYFDAMTSWNGFKKGSSWAMKGVQLKNDIMTSPEARQHWLTGVTRLLTHVNSYTGTRLVDDPAVAVLLFYNELEFYSIRNGLPAAMLPLWRDWLRRRYHNDPSMLAKAWNDPARFRPGMKFDDIPLFGNADQWGVGNGYYADIGLFMIEREKEMNGWFEKAVRQIGYRGLTTLWDMGKQYRNNLARAEMSVISMHNYFGHPTNWLNPGSTVKSESSIADAAQYLRSMVATRFIDRPFFIAEYGHVFWCRYRYEEGLVFGAYSALQGLQGIMVHSSPVTFNVHTPILPFRTGCDPVERANQVMSMFLFSRRDVKTSPRYIELNLGSRFLFENGYLNRAAGDDTKLSLLCRFGVWCGTGNQPVLSDKLRPIRTLSPNGSARLSATANTMDVIEAAGSGQELDRLVAGLKKDGLIPAENLTDPTRGVFQSDTGELLMKTKRHTFTVITPRFEGIATDRDEVSKLAVVSAVHSSIPSSTAVISLDGLPLSGSRHLLLVYNTDALNTGMELSSDHSTLYALGRGPVLMRVGTLRLELQTPHAGRFTVWALGFDGTRREKLPVAAVAGNRLQLTIDTGKLRHGPTPFFEVIVE